MNPNYELAEILRKLNGTMSQKQAAELLGISQAGVSCCCRAHGIIWIRQFRDQNGDNNHNFQNGLSRSTVERTTRRVLRNAGRDLFLCERCSWRSHSVELPRHHKNRDRANNSPENLEVLCWSCHNREHMPEKPRNDLGRFA